MTKQEKKEDKEQLASSDSFCWNPECPDYGRVDADNLRKFGFTRKGRQRWQCTTCQKVVAETRGTLFHGKRYDEQTILECLAMFPRAELTGLHPPRQGDQGVYDQLLARRDRAADGAG